MRTRLGLSPVPDTTPPGDCPSAAAARQYPIFIVGVERSGTTFLQGLLSSIDGIVSTRETAVFEAAYGYKPRRRRLSSHDWECLANCVINIALARGVPIRPPDLLDAFRSIRTREEAVAAFISHLEEVLGGRRLVEKTPNHVRYLDAVAAVYPGAKVLHIYRDPRDVALSVKEAFGRPVLITAYRWRRAMRLVHQHTQGGHCAIMNVCYESLVRRPDDQIREICAFCGESSLPARPASEAAASDLVAPFESWKGNVSLQPAVDRIGRHVTGLSGVEICVIEALLFPWMRAKGYGASRVRSLVGIFLIPVLAIACLPGFIRQRIHLKRVAAAAARDPNEADRQLLELNLRSPSSTARRDTAG